MTNPSNLFFGTRGPRDARVLVVGESWGREEALKHQPFVGGSGQELDRMLAEANIPPTQCLFTNVVSAQPQANDMALFFLPTSEGKTTIPTRGLYPSPLVLDGLERLRQLIATVNPEFIIGFGNYALWALTEDSFRVGNYISKVDKKSRKVPTGIASYRGSQLYTRLEMGNKPFLPTYHPAAVLRQWAWRPAAVHDLRARYEKLKTGAWDPPEYQFTIRPTYAETTEWLESLLADLDLGQVKVSVDLETRAGHIACCGLATSALRAISIPFMCVEDIDGYWKDWEEMQIVWLLIEIFSHPNFFLIGQNFLYDAQYIFRRWNYKVDLEFLKAHDTLVAQHLIFPGTPKGLDYLSSMYCHHHIYWKDEGKLWDPSVGEDQLWRYNCQDAVKTFEVAERQQEVIAALGLDDQWYWECEQLPLMLDMMLRGVRIDIPLRGKQIFELNDAITSRVEFLNQVVPWGDELQTKTGKSPWHNSPIQQRRLFYELFGMKVIRNRKTGAPSVDDEALRLIEQREPILRPVTETLSELRSCKVFRDNFLTSKLDDDLRMRCSFNVHPETFRWSSSESAFNTGTNLQNIPKGSEDE